MLRKRAQAQRVQSEEPEEEGKGQLMPATYEQYYGNDNFRTTKPLRVEYPSHRQSNTNQSPLVSQDDSPLSRNARAARHIKLCTAMDISGVKLTARQASARSFPMQFITDFAGSVLDGETGELLEYQHLIKRPKYKDNWGYSFGNKVGRPCQGIPGRNDGTNTMFFSSKRIKFPGIGKKCNVW